MRLKIFLLITMALALVAAVAACWVLSKNNDYDAKEASNVNNVAGKPLKRRPARLLSDPQQQTRLRDGAKQIKTIDQAISSAQQKLAEVNSDISNAVDEEKKKHLEREKIIIEKTIKRLQEQNL